MKQVHIVISNCGDGSNSLNWFKDTDINDLADLDEKTNDYELWGSGDGVQITTINFPDDFDLSVLGVSWSSIEEILGDKL
jgi:hypothetical protein